MQVDTMPCKPDELSWLQQKILSALLWCREYMESAHQKTIQWQLSQPLGGVVLRSVDHLKIPMEKAW